MLSSDYLLLIHDLRCSMFWVCQPVTDLHIHLPDFQTKPKRVVLHKLCFWFKLWWMEVTETARRRAFFTNLCLVVMILVYMVVSFSKPLLLYLCLTIPCYWLLYFVSSFSFLALSYPLKLRFGVEFKIIVVIHTDMIDTVVDVVDLIAVAAALQLLLLLLLCCFVLRCKMFDTCRDDIDWLLLDSIVL